MGANTQIEISKKTTLKKTKLEKGQGPSLWPKTLYGLIWGLFISMSLMMNVYYLIPLSFPTFLITSLVVGFLIWGSVMLYCYSCSSHKQINVACLKITLASLLTNFVCHFVT